MFQLAYFQMVGAGKARNQDALFDGTAVRQVRLHKTRVSEVDDTVRLAVADGVSSSPAAHLASRRPLQNSPKSPKFPPRHLGDFP